MLPRSASEDGDQRSVGLCAIVVRFQHPHSPHRSRQVLRKLTVRIYL